jgi:hypothetical protein
MGRRKPFTHTVVISRHLMEDKTVKCRLTKRLLITEHLDFNRNTQRMVGGGTMPWLYDPNTLEEIEE